MRAELRKDVKVDDKTKLFKSTKGTVVAITWNDKHVDRYHVEFKEGTYILDKKDIDVY